MHRKNTSKSIRLQPVLKNLKIIENRYFLMKKREIQVILFMTMLTRSSKRIINPMRFTGLSWSLYRLHRVINNIEGTTVLLLLYYLLLYDRLLFHNNSTKKESRDIYLCRFGYKATLLKLFRIRYMQKNNLGMTIYYWSMSRGTTFVIYFHLTRGQCSMRETIYSFGISLHLNTITHLSLVDWP